MILVRYYAIRKPTELLMIFKKALQFTVNGENMVKAEKGKRIDADTLIADKCAFTVNLGINVIFLAFYLIYMFR